MPKLKLVKDNTSTGNWLEVVAVGSSTGANVNNSAEALQSLKDQIESLLSETDRVSDAEISMDTPEQRSHTQPMNDISRSELDTKLQLIEERLDRKVSDIAASVETLKASNKSTLDALGNAKWWAIGTAIAVLTVFLGTLQWGLSAQKEENARFSSYIREDVKSIGDDMKDVAKTLTEIRVKLEPASNSK